MDNLGNIYIIYLKKAFCFDKNGELVWSQTYDDFFNANGTSICFLEGNIYSYAQLDSHYQYTGIISINAANGVLNWMLNTIEYTNYTLYNTYEMTLTSENITTAAKYVGIGFFGYNGLILDVLNQTADKIPSSNIVVDSQGNLFYGTYFGESFISLSSEQNINWELPIDYYFIQNIALYNGRAVFTTRHNPYLWVIR